ncbi:MAG: SH3 domain-containing protein [Syntrophaceae bacterium]|nr:SH3 domain-containing protein [Deltaproteobacteria bacterium]
MSSALLACALVIVPSLCLQAKEMYVRDWIVITVRSAPYETAQSVAAASTNDMVEVLEDGEVWTRIRTKAGKEGWVLSRYLTPDLPQNLPVRQLEEKIKVLQDENRKLRGLTPSGSYGAGTGAAGIAAFKNCPELQVNYEKLLIENKARTGKMDLLAAENSRLKTSERLVFTLIGGLFIGIGIVVGLFLQAARSRPRKPGLRF